MLSEILYYIFIYPMQSLLDVMLSVLYSFTNSYGVSIILLSILINLFLLKIVRISESKANKTACLKAVCDSKLKEFKRAFKGAELNAYTQILYKQKHYHPIYALFSLGGLALQVPFFLGIFFLLDDMEILKSANFGAIASLSAPDAILWGVNLLPILMFAFTIINVFLSSKEKGARVQGSLIAAIFLVLLYAMPSALVLYWSTSMAFSLCKTLISKIKTNTYTIQSSVA